MQLPGLWENTCQHITTMRAKDETNCLGNYSQNEIHTFALTQ